MTREEWEKRLPLIQAFVDGKAIEVLNYRTGKWNESESIAFTSFIDRYRIKAMPKCRPFKDSNECFEEMKKHEPFGWVQVKESKVKLYIFAMDRLHVETRDGIREYKSAFEFCDFVDGTPFGIKEEES